MSNSENLRKIFQDVQVSGKFEKNEINAVLTILIQMADRLDKVEHVCEIQHPGQLFIKRPTTNATSNNTSYPNTADMMPLVSSYASARSTSSTSGLFRCFQGQKRMESRQKLQSTVVPMNNPVIMVAHGNMRPSKVPNRIGWLNEILSLLAVCVPLRLCPLSHDVGQSV